MAEDEAQEESEEENVGNESMDSDKWASFLFLEDFHHYIIIFLTLDNPRQIP